MLKIVFYSPVIIVIFFTAWGLAWLPIALPLARLIKYQLTSPLTVKQKIIFLLSLYPLAPLIIWLIIRQQEISFADIGMTREIFISLGWGMILGLITLTIVFLLESILGLVDWHWNNLQKLLASATSILVLSLVISLIEEIVFRGFILSELNQDYPYWLGAIVSSLLFALLHLVWEQKNTLPQIPGLWLMGMVLVVARLANHGGLGIAWGLHTGWIWGLSCLDSSEILTYRNEKSWITGINQQPLAGLAGIFCLLITLALLFLPNILPTP